MEGRTPYQAFKCKVKETKIGEENPVEMAAWPTTARKRVLSGEYDDCTKYANY
jgi:hypothetical protein